VKEISTAVAARGDVEIAVNSLRMELALGSIESQPTGIPDQILDANSDNISTKFSTLRYRRGLAYSSARSISRTLVSNEIAQS
jgi:hypothetical protein